MQEHVSGSGPDRKAGTVSDQKLEEEALSKANELLNRLFSDTRHDILNQLTILLGYLELSDDMVTDPKLKEFLKREENAAEMIGRQIAFTKDLKDIGIRPPEWQDVKTVVQQAAGTIEALTIRIENDVGAGVEIYASPDPFLRKIFSNLIENTHTHGKKATFVRISTQNSGDGLTILFEDDGEGIPVADKERIFSRLWPGRQNLGLYFVREVLALTGITISEKGEPGKGARFEIGVPAGVFRK